MIFRCTQFAIRPRLLYLLILRRHSRNTSFPRSRFFSRRRTLVDSPISVIARARHVPIILDPRLVNIVNSALIHIVHRAVVVEPPSLPASSLVSASGVSISIINSAVESDFWSPISVVKAIPVAFVTPISRRPQISWLRRFHPRSRHPVVVIFIVVPRPISGRPDVPFAWDRRLFIHRQFRRCEIHRKLDVHLR